MDSYQPSATIVAQSDDPVEEVLQAEVELEPSPAEHLDGEEMVTMFRNCADHPAIDKLKYELAQQYPEQREDIQKEAEFRGEQIASE